MILSKRFLFKAPFLVLQDEPDVGRNPMCIAYSIGSTRRLIGHITTQQLVFAAFFTIGISGTTLLGGVLTGVGRSPFIGVGDGIALTSAARRRTKKNIETV